MTDGYPSNLSIRRTVSLRSANVMFLDFDFEVPIPFTFHYFSSRLVRRETRQMSFLSWLAMSGWMNEWSWDNTEAGPGDMKNGMGWDGMEWDGRESGLQSVD